MRIEVSELNQTLLKQHSCQLIEGGRGGWDAGEISVLEVREH